MVRYLSRSTDGETQRDNAAGCNTNGPTPTTLAARTVQPSPSKSHGPIATATGAPPDVDESGSKALSSGAILGIFLAAIVIVGSIVGAFVVVRLRNKERERQARERQSIKIRTSGSHSFERTDTWKMDDRPLPSRPPPCHQFV
jgi:hypothetical protein